MVIGKQTKTRCAPSLKKDPLSKRKVYEIKYEI